MNSSRERGVNTGTATKRRKQQPKFNTKLLEPKNSNGLYACQICERVEQTHGDFNLHINTRHGELIQSKHHRTKERDTEKNESLIDQTTLKDIMASADPIYKCIEKCIESQKVRKKHFQQLFNLLNDLIKQHAPREIKDSKKKNFISLKQCLISGCMKLLKGERNHIDEVFHRNGGLINILHSVNVNLTQDEREILTKLLFWNKNDSFFTQRTTRCSEVESLCDEVQHLSDKQTFLEYDKLCTMNGQQSLPNNWQIELFLLRNGGKSLLGEKSIAYRVACYIHQNSDIGIFHEGTRVSTFSQTDSAFQLHQTHPKSANEPTCGEMTSRPTTIPRSTANGPTARSQNASFGSVKKSSSKLKKRETKSCATNESTTKKQKTNATRRTGPTQSRPTTKSKKHAKRKAKTDAKRAPKKLKKTHDCSPSSSSSASMPFTNDDEDAKIELNDKIFQHFMDLMTVIEKQYELVAAHGKRTTLLGAIKRCCTVLGNDVNLQFGTNFSILQILEHITQQFAEKHSKQVVDLLNRTKNVYQQNLTPFHPLFLDKYRLKNVVIFTDVMTSSNRSQIDNIIKTWQDLLLVVMKKRDEENGVEIAECCDVISVSKKDFDWQKEWDEKIPVGEKYNPLKFACPFDQNHFKGAPKPRAHLEGHIQLAHCKGSTHPYECLLCPKLKNTTEKWGVHQKWAYKQNTKHLLDISCDGLKLMFNERFQKRFARPSARARRGVVIGAYAAVEFDDFAQNKKDKETMYQFGKADGKSGKRDYDRAIKYTCHFANSKDAQPCNKIFRTKVLYDMHMVEHDYCETCGVRTSRHKKAFQLHRNTGHKFVFFCEECVLLFFSGKMELFFAHQVRHGRNVGKQWAHWGK